LDKPQFESIDQMAETTAAALSQACAGSAFQLFQDKSFRWLADFNKLNQVEHDRIFNELVVAHLVLIMLILEAPDLRVVDEFRGPLEAGGFSTCLLLLYRCRPVLTYHSLFRAILFQTQGSGSMKNTFPDP